MKILVVTNMYPDRNESFLYQGVFVKEQVESLRSREGVDCDVFIIDGFKSKLNYFIGAIKVFLKIKGDNYDIVHVHYGLSGLFMLLNPFKVWSNVIVTLHGGDILLEQKNPLQVLLSKLVIKRAGKTVILNDEMDRVVKRCGLMPVILPCGSDSDYFNATYADNRENIFIFPGNPQRAEKNYPLFKQIVDAYSQLYGPVQIVTLDCFSRQEVSELLSTSKALIMTSVSEGSPQVIKEALLSDLPVISTYVGDVPSTLSNVDGTFVFDATTNDFHAVAKEINKCIQKSIVTPGERRSRVLALGLDQKTVTDKLLSLYTSLIPMEGQ